MSILEFFVFNFKSIRLQIISKNRVLTKHGKCVTILSRGAKMLLWRVCNIKEEQAILKNDFEKLTFGSPLCSYIGSPLCSCIKDPGLNYYPQFDNMMKEVWSLKGDERLKPILKMFPFLPKEIPLFEKNEDKQKEIMNKFVPFNEYNAYSEKYYKDYLGEYVFLNSIKIAGFFDTCCVRYFKAKLRKGYSKVITINIPDKIALNYKGYGEYRGDCESFVYPEYAIPLYLLKPEYFNLDNITKEERKKMYLKARDRGEQIVTKNIFKDEMSLV